ITVVVSARSSATDDLENILNKASKGHPYKEVLQVFKDYQTEPLKDIDFSKEFASLDKLFEGVSLLGDYSNKTKDEILAQGELLSVKLIAALLNKKGVKAVSVDARELIKTDGSFGNAQPISQVSKDNVRAFYKNSDKDVVNIVTGFIASNTKNETTTLGRN